VELLRFGGAAILLMATVVMAGCRQDHGSASVGEPKPAAPLDPKAINPDRRSALRDLTLASARVWHAPAVPIPEANLRHNPPGPGRIDETEEVECRFALMSVGGTTPKFYCELPNGERLKIKYGSGNPELHAEVAASRLLVALGFGADRMFIVRRVRCAGCPRFPFQSLRCFDRVGLRSACFPGGIDYRTVVEFDEAVIERMREGRRIEATEDQGWAWYELDRIDPARGGSSRAEVDALRLMAVLLAHWDNKSTNQRLLCVPGADGPDGTCAHALAMIQDLGATFGPLKIDLHNWRHGLIWKDGATCTVSMEQLPWGGGTFPEWRITEAGRRLLLGLLEQLTDQQLHDLFEGSRVTSHDQFSADARNPGAWVLAFKDKVRQIRDGGPCPS
jgi:hypothetical protein